MGVQAQYPSNALAPDFRVRDKGSLPRTTPTNAVLESYGHLDAGEQQKFNFVNGAGISDPGSDLTCNASGSRKRSREDDDVMVLPEPGRSNHHHHHHHISHGLGFATTAAAAAAGGVPKMPDKATPVALINPNSVGLQPSHEQSRLQWSAGTSTSGRPPAISPLAGDLLSHLYHQSLEIDALVRFQSEKIRLGLEEARKRHCRALMSILEQKAVKRLKEKEAELESVSRRNAELEEKARQIATESQIWFNVAKNNEAIAASLRTTLEQALLQNAASGSGGRAKEGYGDSDGAPFPADDAQSCCFEEEAMAERGIIGGGREEELRQRRGCKVCQQKEVGVLLLPCRHLCLCRDCESTVHTCPICQSLKNASFQIFMG
ncbi:putative BOI-related E3 ubiquitin-protein ligase 3 [Cocos nucifera]|nr:putative BOI-related E3 ubiquitin-protein ligase 3 [Cocos nucifera]